MTQVTTQAAGYNPACNVKLNKNNHFVIVYRGCAVTDFRRDVYCLLGLPFDAVDMNGAVRRVRDAAAQRTSCFISTPNVNFLIGCRTDSRFRDSVINSDLSIADGMPLVWIARLLGIPIRERVAGSCLFDRLKAESSSRLSVYFFGGKEGVAEAASRLLNATPSGLACAGFESPGFGPVEEMSSDESIRKINASGADFLMISMGAKKAQSWIEHNRARIVIPVISNLGATLNFAAGKVNRAPTWMQNNGLEWLWRVKEERALWHRYFWDSLALFALVATRVLPYAWYLLWHKPGANQLASAGLDTREDGQNYIVRLKGAWTRHNIGPLRDCFLEAVRTGKDLKLEMSGVTYVDSAFVGLVMLFQGHQAQRGRRLLIASPSKPVLQVLEFCCAEYLCSSAAGGKEDLPQE